MLGVTKLMEYRIETVKGFSKYSVDTNGIVYKQNGKPFSYSSINHRGYIIINLMNDDGKRVGVSVHTVVANQFLTHDKEHNQVNHKDGNKQNNNIENLEWVTPSENMRHAVDKLGCCIGVNNGMSVKICCLSENSIVKEYNSIMDAAREIATENLLNPRYVQTGIWRALNGIRKTYKGLSWEYIK